MRSLRSTPMVHRLGLSACAALGALCGACNWMEFDDLADTAWVTTTGAPSGVNSNDFAVAVLEANNELATPAETKQLAVVSRGDLTLAFFSYTAAGELTSRQTISLSTNNAGPFEQLSPSPVVAADPRSGRVVVASDGRVALGDPSRSTVDTAMLTNSASAAGATFLVSGGKTYVAAASERGIFFVDFSVTPAVVATCMPVAGLVRTVALGTVTLAGVDQLLVWYQNDASPARAELQAFTVGIVGSTCTLTAAGAAYTDLSLPNGSEYPLIPGARIVTLPDGDSVAISDPIKAQVTLHKLSAPTSVTSLSVPDLASLSIGKIGTDSYLVAGSPNQDVDNTANSGRVQLFKLTGATAAASPDLTLHDASPDTEQRFGRSAVLLPFADAASPILVVGASNEMFSYFRTTLYSERRAR